MSVRRDTLSQPYPCQCSKWFPHLSLPLFRYLNGLHAHLTCTILHLIIIGTEGDTPALQKYIRAHHLVEDGALQAWISFAESTFINEVTSTLTPKSIFTQDQAASEGETKQNDAGLVLKIFVFHVSKNGSPFPYTRACT